MARGTRRRVRRVRRSVDGQAAEPPLTTIALRRHRAFVKLWAGQTVSSFGTQLGALSLTALILLKASPGQMGLLGAASGVPVLVLGLGTGVWIDRVRRRPLLVAADIGRAALLASVPAAAALGALRMTQLYAVALLTGTLTLIFDLSWRSYLPSLVARDALVDANSKLQMSESVCEVGAPAAGGALVQALGAPVAVAADAVTFLLSGIAIGLIRTPETRPPVRSRGRLGRDAIDGLRAVGRDPILRALAGLAATSGFFGSFIGALYGVYAIRELHLEVVVLGLVVGAGGLGSLAGAALSTRLVRRFGLGRAMLTAQLVHAILCFSIPLASGPAVVAASILLAGQVLSDPFWAVADITTSSLGQARAPDALRGRVNAALHVVKAGPVPAGALAGGWLGSAIGLRPTLVVAACGMTAGCLWLLASPIPRLREMAPADAAEAGPA